jgi:hypothetical protein
MDWFHWTFGLAGLIVITELVIACCFSNPPIRLVAMPLASACLIFGTILLLNDTLRFYNLTSPIRISSLPAGRPLLPGIYPYIEDVVAVDGGGGQAFRYQLRARYEASPIFRRMLARLSWFWGIGAEVIGGLTTILVFLLDAEVGYVVGWSLPFLWAGIWVISTIYWVKKELKVERASWAETIS